MPRIPLATLVVMNIDDGDYLQAISVRSTPFNNPFEWCSVHNACAGVGFQGHLWIQKWSTMIFSKGVPRPIGVLNSNKWFKAILSRFRPTRASASSKKALKLAILGLIVQHRRVRRKCGLRVDR